MSFVDLILAAEAAQQQQAVRRTAYRHRHLSDKPLVVVAFNLSGEAAAPLGFCYGTSPNKPTLALAAEPRNRESRFAAINKFSADLVAYLSPYLELHEIDAGRKGHQYKLRVATAAPQIIVPNTATRNYLGERLGRSLRYLGLGETHEVPDETSWSGAHLSWLAEHAHMPGQSIFLAATELLGRHYVTGQSALEDENLASFLAWIGNAPGAGLAAIDAAEDSALGPVPDPRWESTLEPLVADYNAATRAENERRQRAIEKRIFALIAEELKPAYESTWQAVSIMRKISPAAKVADRWQEDLRAWSSHARRCEKGIPRFAKRQDARRAARSLEMWSSALEHLEADEAFDDPLVMAGLDAQGLCITGTIQSVDASHKEVKPGNIRATAVPLVTIESPGPTRLLPGAEVIWANERGVKAEVRTVTASSVELAVTGGHKSGTVLPQVGQAVVFASLDPFGGRPPREPEDVPWTHRPDSRGPTTSDLAAEITERDLLTDAPDESPDLPVADLADLPVLGPIGPEDVPAVTL